MCLQTFVHLIVFSHWWGFDNSEFGSSWLLRVIAIYNELPSLLTPGFRIRLKFSRSFPSIGRVFLRDLQQSRSFRKLILTQCIAYDSRYLDRERLYRHIFFKEWNQLLTSSVVFSLSHCRNFLNTGIDNIAQHTFRGCNQRMNLC